MFVEQKKKIFKKGSNMKITNWEEAESFIIGQLDGDKRLGDEEYEKADVEISKAFETVKSEVLEGFIDKILNMNILEKKFERFSKLPKTWLAIQIMGMNSVNK